MIWVARSPEAEHLASTWYMRDDQFSLVQPATPRLIVAKPPEQLFQSSSAARENLKSLTFCRKNGLIKQVVLFTTFGGYNCSTANVQ